MASPLDPMSPGPSTPAEAFKAAGSAAAKAAAAGAVAVLQTAAANAGKPGSHSSEFALGIGATIVVPAILACLKALAVATVPWLAIPALALTSALGAGAYALSRGQVKTAALQAAAAAVASVAQQVAPPPSQ